VKRRFSIWQVGRGRPGPGTAYEVLVRLTDPSPGRLTDELSLGSVTGSDGPATRAEAQRHVDWLNYAEECFYAGLPVPLHVAGPTVVVEGDLSEIERRIAATMASGAQYDTGPDDPYSASTPTDDV
jgi:hypothetical protein